jgi:hypothetical protein
MEHRLWSDALPRRLDHAELEMLLAAARKKTPGYYPLFVLLAFTASVSGRHSR